MTWNWSLDDSRRLPIITRKRKSGIKTLFSHQPGRGTSDIRQQSSGDSRRNIPHSTFSTFDPKINSWLRSAARVYQLVNTKIIYVLDVTRGKSTGKWIIKLKLMILKLYAVTYTLYTPSALPRGKGNTATIDWFPLCYHAGWPRDMAFIQKFAISFMLSWMGQTRHDNSSKNFVQNFVL